MGDSKHAKRLDHIETVGAMLASGLIASNEMLPGGRGFTVEEAVTFFGTVCREVAARQAEHDEELPDGGASRAARWWDMDITEE